MRLLVIDDNFPNEDNLYGDVFVHVRVKEYLKIYPDIVVASSLNKTNPDYNYEGVNVKCVGSIPGLINLIETFNPDTVLIHFATFPIIREIVFRFQLPFIIWVHGFEALAWYRRLFNLKSVRNFAAYIKGNLIQLYYFRKLIKRSNRSSNIHFVFVSEWMKKIAETDCLIKIDHFSIIPNPIDDTFFSYTPKQIEDSFRLLMIRPFESRKYGTDIVTDALVLLKHKPLFKKLVITIYGKGSTSSKLFHEFSEFSNVIIKEGFLKQEEIKNLHDQNGIFLAITRQDAQGVSMCEAMSSGLVVISSNNTAIPEFVTNNVSGVLVENKAEQVAEAIEKLTHDAQFFWELSKGASLSIKEKAGIQVVIKNELRLISEYSSMFKNRS